MIKNYIDNLSEEVKNGHREKAEEGGWPTFAPIGYVNVAGKLYRGTYPPVISRQLWDMV